MFEPSWPVACEESTLEDDDEVPRVRGKCHEASIGGLIFIIIGTIVGDSKYFSMCHTILDQNN